MFVKQSDMLKDQQFKVTVVLISQSIGKKAINYIVVDDRNSRIAKFFTEIFVDQECIECVAVLLLGQAIDMVNLD